MKILIAGAGGFIAGHLTRALAKEGHEITAVDIKPLNEWFQVRNLKKVKNVAKIDLKNRNHVGSLIADKDRVYNLACNMGGMGFIQNNHIDCLESVLIQTNFITAMREMKTSGAQSIFYSSSACAYPESIQQEIDSPAIKESDAYPAAPQDGYGWEKLFSEIITQYGKTEEGLNVRIARFHNCYGPLGTWQGNRTKAPAALCQKIIEAQKNKKKEIEIWGDGEQTRSFMYIDDCIEGIQRLWQSDYSDPVNLGSAELVSINQMVGMIEDIAGIKLERKYLLDKPQGVRGRNSDNTLIKKVTGGWEPSTKLYHGLEKTYAWIHDQMSA